jgi:hypothetical protein
MSAARDEGFLAFPSKWARVRAGNEGQAVGKRECGRCGRGSGQTSYTMTPLANGDDFAVVVGQFNFQLDQHNLQGMLDTYEKHTGLSIVKSLPTTISGQPGYLVASKSTSGRDTRYATLVTYRGNTVYIFVIRTYPETTSDEASFKAFLDPTI